jgi:hypothetical protein
MAYEQGIARDLFYVLSCINQFELPEGSRLRDMLHVLIYGLFRPLDRNNNQPGSRDITVLRDLLGALAYQLRMLRRRGVVPTLVSLGTFFIAFVFSIVLAFGDVGDNTTAHSLALGLLFSWMPLLVVFTIIDRNPVSADRSA